MAERRTGTHDSGLFADGVPLLQRGIEREVLPALKAHGMGLIAWSALGRGVLSGKYRSGIPADSRAGNPVVRQLRPAVPDRRRLPDRRCHGYRGRGGSV